MSKYPFNKPCEQCSQPFVVKDASSRHQLFCGVICAANAKRKHTKLDNCLQCQRPLSKTQYKFCSSNCSAKHSNSHRQLSEDSKNKTRIAILANNGKTLEEYLSRRCIVCDAHIATRQEKYCSMECFRQYCPLKTKEDLKAKNRAGQGRWREKNYKNISPDADRSVIKNIYKNCPDGYEVDHILPLSRGGLHHEDNLQYLLIEENRKKGNKLQSELDFIINPISWKEFIS
jgi:hypothetical protein